MPTVRDICIRALRKLDVAPLGQAVPGEEIEQAVDAYNDMLHGWELQGIYISHATQQPNDEFLLPDAFIEGTVYMLASRLSPNYVIPAQFSINEFVTGLQAATMRISPVPVNVSLLRLPSQRFRRYS